MIEGELGPAALRSVQYVEVDDTGKIHGQGTCQPEVAGLYSPIDENNMLVWFVDQLELSTDFDKFYYDGTEVLLRIVAPVQVSKATITADDVDEAVITGIPASATVELDGAPIDGLEGDTITITSPMPATYRVRVECWPFLPFEVEIVAQ